jgi:hypothetical protein
MGAALAMTYRMFGSFRFSPVAISAAVVAFYLLLHAGFIPALRKVRQNHSMCKTTCRRHLPERTQLHATLSGRARSSAL